MRCGDRGEHEAKGAKRASRISVALDVRTLHAAHMPGSTAKHSGSEDTAGMKDASQLESALRSSMSGIMIFLLIPLLEPVALPPWQTLAFTLCGFLLRSSQYLPFLSRTATCQSAASARFSQPC